MVRTTFLCAQILFVGVVFATTAAGSGFTNDSVGSKATLMSSAFTGIADDASAVFYNPAGLAFPRSRGWNTDTYASYGFTGFEYEKDGIKDESDENFTVPGFFVARAGTRWSFGIGVYTPWAGGGTTYKNFQESGHTYRNASAFTAFTPALAYKIRSNLSVGAGLSVFYGFMESRYTDPVTFASVKADYSGLSGVSGHVALMYAPLETLKIGFCARSKFPADIDGDVKIDGYRHPSRVELSLPWSFTLGVGYTPWKKLTLGLDVSYLMYGDLDAITVKTTGLPTDHVRTQYKNVWEIKFGFDYQATERLAIRAGCFFSEGATRLEGLKAASNDVDLVIPTGGLAYRLTDALEVSLGVIYTEGLARKFAGQRFDQNHWIPVAGMRLDFWAPVSDDAS